MADILTAVKRGLRITESNTDFDEEITDLIEQAKSDLGASGVKSACLSFTAETDTVEMDSNIRQAVTLYSKAYFGLENPDKEWYVDRYLYKKAELTNQITQYAEYQGGGADV